MSEYDAALSAMRRTLISRIEHYEQALRREGRAYMKDYLSGRIAALRDVVYMIEVDLCRNIYTGSHQ